MLFEARIVWQYGVAARASLAATAPVLPVLLLCQKPLGADNPHAVHRQPQANRISRRQVRRTGDMPLAASANRSHSASLLIYTILERP